MGHFFWNEWNRAGLRIWKALGNYGKPRQKLQPPEGWSSMSVIFLVVQKSSKATPSSSLQMSQRKGKTGKTNINKHTKSSTSPNLDHIWCMWACSCSCPGLLPSSLILFLGLGRGRLPVTLASLFVVRTSRYLIFWWGSSIFCMSYVRTVEKQRWIVYLHVLHCVTNIVDSVDLWETKCHLL